MDVIAAAVDEVVRARHAALEEACERALQGGVCGVAVVRDGAAELIGPSPVVPYGLIHYYPSREAYETVLFRDV